MFIVSMLGFCMVYVPHSRNTILYMKIILELYKTTKICYLTNLTQFATLNTGINKYFY